jgi:hypothetical protein
MAKREKRKSHYVIRDKTGRFIAEFDEGDPYPPIDARARAGFTEIYVRYMRMLGYEPIDYVPAVFDDEPDGEPPDGQNFGQGAPKQ